MNPQGIFNNKLFSSLAAMAVVMSMALVSTAQVRSGDLKISTDKQVETFAPTAIPFPGPDSPSANPSCATLDALHQPGDPINAYAHISDDWGIKFDFPSPNGSFPIAVGNGVSLEGGMPANPSLSLNISSVGSTMNQWNLTPLTFPPLDRLVSAVIVKGGNEGANVYLYPSLSAGDIGPFTTPNSQNAISHLIFCFEPFTAPTAANGTISGRAIRMDGTGISSARIEVLNLSTGEIRNAITNPFGYYTFEGIETNDLYMVTVSHKRYQFANPQRTISFDGDIVDLDFVAF
ncbi:MAG TPA: carboxypeptidase-like regulatory domain-containing protein [Pyrinomonadaceae bacterium]|nr:carboxypeptidase-like regulatory domain-containing protein [Pyrinomonadaceae bacterium]